MKQLSMMLDEHPPVTLKSSFQEILGEKSEDIPAPERRARWESWKRLAMAAGESATLEIWTTPYGCAEDGKCRDLDGDWCHCMGLPATVNPILSFREGIPGMACMGFHYEPEAEQTT